MRILTDFIAKNHSKLPITDKDLIQYSVVSMTFHLTCVSEVIILPIKELQHFFITFSYKLYISLKSVKRRITPQF